MMDRQLRRPARVQRQRPTPFTGPRIGRGAMDGRTGGGDETRIHAAQELVGLMFSTAKELRHVAEQHYGEEFVPTSTLEDAPLRTVISLRTERAGTLVVHAERERHWYPFRVVRVDVPRLEPRPNGRGEGQRLRLPHNFRTPSRPRIDWL